MVVRVVGGVQWLRHNGQAMERDLKPCRGTYGMHVGTRRNRKASPQPTWVNHTPYLTA